MPLPYPPPWQDISTLAAHICVSTTTVENWVAQGLLPPGRLRGGKRLWKWAEVEQWLEAGGPSVAQSVDTLAERIRNGTRAAAAERRHS